MTVNRLALSERLTQICGGQVLHTPKCHYSVCGEDAHLLVAI